MSNYLNVTKKNVVRAIIEKINKEKDEIRIFTDYFPGYHSPDYIDSCQNNSHKPDITTLENGHIDVYEIELEKSGKPDKWKCFEKYAVNNKGELFIILPESNGEVIKQKLKSEKIKANLIYFNL